LHAVAHEPHHRNGGPFTCDGGHQCHEAMAVLAGGMQRVTDGEAMITEVLCVPVGAQEEIRMVKKLQVALVGLLAGGKNGYDWTTSRAYGERVEREAAEFLKGRK
jgi:hypothetical protein